MPTTTFAAGTVIASTWLNELDQLRFDNDGSAYVKHTSTGIGASARALNAVLDDHDILSSNFPTLQEAFTAAAGKTLKIVGTYSLGSTTITVSNNTTVIAYGASLTWSGNVDGISLGSGCVWRGGTLTGAGGGTYNTNGNAFKCYGTAGAGGSDAPTYKTGPKIYDVTITGWSNAAFWLGYIQKFCILNCTVTTIGYAGIGGVSCEDGLIDGNYIDGVAGSGSADWYGMFVDRSEGTEIQNPRSKRIKISNNTIKNVTSWEAIDTHAGQDFVIVSNTISGCRFGIVAVTSDISGIESLGPYRIVIAQNTIQGGSTGACITVKGVAADLARGIVVANNVCLNGGWTNDTNEGAIRIYQVLDITVTGNTLRNSYVYGINLINDVSAATISANTIIDPIDTTHTTPACIAIGSSNVKAHIVGNTFVYQNSGASTYVAVRSINIAGAATGLDVELGPNAFIGIDSTHLTYNAGTTSGVYATNLMNQAGVGTLVGGTLTVTFPKRFPAAPIVNVSPNSAANVVRAHTISATGFTCAGTGTDTFTYSAYTV